MMIMPAYAIAFIQPTNPAFKEYPPLFSPTLKPYDGKTIFKCMVSEAATNGGPEFKEEGANDFKIAIGVEFPTLEKATAWKNCAEYQSIIGIRLENSTGPLIVCDGTGKSVESGASAYCLAFLKATGPKFTEYPPKVQATLDPYGGEFLVRCRLDKPAGDGGPAYAERTTAEDYTVAVLLGFPTVEKLHGWNDSSEYYYISLQWLFYLRNSLFLTNTCSCCLQRNTKILSIFVLTIPLGLLLDARLSLRI
jgi:uncharacterized protein (DUF1330 family)